MLRKILHAVRGEAAPSIVYERFPVADDVLRVRFTPYEIIYPSGLKLLYLPYAEVQWAYIRTQAHRVTLGCCAGDIEEHHLMLMDRSGHITAVPFDRLSHAEAAIRLISQYAPHIRTGFTPENRARFAG